MGKKSVKAGLFIYIFFYKSSDTEPQKKSHYAKCGKVLAKIWSSSNKYIII